MLRPAGQEQDSLQEDYPQWLGQIGQDYGKDEDEDEVHLQGHDLAALNIAQVKATHRLRRVMLLAYQQAYLPIRFINISLFALVTSNKITVTCHRFV
jgi:hypothetical protein